MRLSAQTIHRRLTDATLPVWQRLLAQPYRVDALQGCSLDVHLGAQIKQWHGSVMDSRQDSSPWWRVLEATSGGGGPAWVLQPGHFYLAVLEELIQVPEDCCGQLVGVSTVARQGVVIHQQAGLLDPGWYGRATLEVTVECEHTILYGGMRVGQVVFDLLDERTEAPYAGRYQGNLDPTPAAPGAA